MKKKLLILGCGGNASINFVKCLRMSDSANQYVIYGTDLNAYYLEASNVDVKIPYDNTIDKTKFILKLIDSYKIDFIHAQPDPEVEFLLSEPLLKNYIFEHNLDIWQKFSSKDYCQSVWGNKFEYLCCTYTELLTRTLIFDRMKKAGNGKVWVRYNKGAGSKAALPVTTLKQAFNWIAYWVEARGMEAENFIFAEYLGGSEYAVQTFWYNGVLKSIYSRERLIYFFGALMPSGQTSTPAVAKSIPPPHYSYDVAIKSILNIDTKPHGIYCVDLKTNNKGDIIPMEVNYGRFFTTSDFFATIGINMPELYVNSFFEKEANEVMPKIEDDNEYLWIRGLDKVPTLKITKKIIK